MSLADKLFKGDKHHTINEFNRTFTITVIEQKTKKLLQFSLKASRREVENEYEDLIANAKEALDAMLRQAMGV